MVGVLASLDYLSINLGFMDLLLGQLNRDYVDRLL